MQPSYAIVFYELTSHYGCLIKIKIQEWRKSIFLPGEEVATETIEKTISFMAFSRYGPVLV